MTQQELKQIMHRNMIFECEIDDAIAFIAELLEHQAEEIKANEPYAMRSIRDIENAANIVWNLQDYVGDITEE